MNNSLSDVVLTEEETELFSTLRKVVEEEELGTTVRVAGGWVRDKLLGVGGKEDVDIALDNMAGNDFAMKLNDWHRKNGFRSFKIGLIQSNPEKSKHLETATVQLGRLSVDFVNLRTETYADDSRIPVMTFGTPLEDAMRRDLTINSLFYNIHTNAVEDFSGRGVADLIEGIIRTPLPALVTFQDDPLRVLRAVRFACRFEFDVSSDLLIAASDITVRVALGTKVSRERVLVEVESMIKSIHSTRAVGLLKLIGLIHLVLPIPEVDDLCLPTVNNGAAGDRSSSGDAVKTKKKKNNDDVEPISVNTPEEIVTINQITQDFHAYGCSAVMIMSLLEQASNKGSRMISTEATPADMNKDIIGQISQLMYQETSFLQHFFRDLKTYQSDETAKVLRFSALTAVGSRICKKSLKKKHKNVSLTEHILLVELKMRSKDVEQAVLIQGSADTFSSLIKEIILHGHSPGAVSTSESIGSTGPSHGVMSRLHLGLAIRSAGILYTQSIQLAISQLILESLHSDLNNYTQNNDKNMIIEGKNNENNDFDVIFSTLLEACELPKMNDAIKNYRNMQLSEMNDSNLIDEDDIQNHLLSSLNMNSINKNINNNEYVDIKSILVATNKLLEAITVLDLSESYKVTPLLTGDKVKTVLKNIPKGAMFGEVMQCQVKW
eukprot:CAMPEP_0119046230 /NCGR_PEP_ID=MMETSP1177-20130426/45243_1 /TAXON_ID=2985 /ORGANISM="Ochromonas sp, Strain CCMP1899" /LENGTH=662 /DNA_ID=CAMNT_0007019101 /DNA_START=210 /DNA_END=2195 /DNA_ORIENTATION=-